MHKVWHKQSLVRQLSTYISTVTKFHHGKDWLRDDDTSENPYVQMDTGFYLSLLLFLLFVSFT